MFPYGIQELNIDKSDLTVKPYYPDIEFNLLTSFLNWINSNQPTIHVDKMFDLDEYKSVHLALEQYYVGKLYFSITKWLTHIIVIIKIYKKPTNNFKVFVGFLFTK